MSGITHALFGGQSQAEKDAQASAKQQVLLTARQGEADAASIAQGQTPASRLAAAAGRRLLTFQGFSTGAGATAGLPNTLGG